MSLIVRSSDIHAAGCYTIGKIRKGTHILEYTGPRITRERADQIYDGRATTYLFGLDDGEKIIDGHGTAMFINHSCDPNCETDEIDSRVWVIALRDIQAGEELTYDYMLYDGADDDPALCYCGSQKCRGTMYSPQEIRKQRRLKSKQSSSAA
jgi:SET domain-containing protein